MPKARVWRSTGKIKKRTTPAATLSQSAMPTKERLGHAAGQFEIGGLGPRRIVRMLDAPLEQMLARQQVTEQQFQILARFRLHWFLGYQAGSLHAVDLDRMIQRLGKIESVGEQEMLHRERVDRAFGALQALEHAVLVKVVLEEYSPNTVGAWIGYNSPYHGRQAVLESLRHAAGRIMSAWLTMDRS